MALKYEDRAESPSRLDCYSCLGLRRLDGDGAFSLGPVDGGVEVGDQQTLPDRSSTVPTHPDLVRQESRIRGGSLVGAATMVAADA